METRERNLYMLLTTFMLLDERTYWLYAKIRRCFNSLKPLPSKVRTLFGRLRLLGFTVH